MKKTSIDITQENSKFRILLNKKIQKTVWDYIKSVAAFNVKAKTSLNALVIIEIMITSIAETFNQLLFNRDLNHRFLVYMFSFRFSGSIFLINLRRQFRVLKFFSRRQLFEHVFARFPVFSFILRLKLLLCKSKTDVSVFQLRCNGGCLVPSDVFRRIFFGSN